MATIGIGTAVGAVAGGALGAMGRDSNKTLTTSSSGKTSSKESGNTSSTWRPNEAAEPMYGYLAGQGSQLMQSAVPYFQGQGYVGPSAATQLGTSMQMGMLPYGLQAVQQMYGGAGASQGAYNQAAGMAPQAANLYGQSSNAYGMGAGSQLGLLGGANRNYNFLSNAADVANNPYVQGQADAMTRRLNQNFRENLLPQINSGAQQVNALGSSRQGIAQAQGAERTQEQLSQGLASLYGSAYNTGLGAQQSALGQTGAMLSNQLAPANALSQAGQQQMNAMNAFGQAGQYLQQGQQDYANNMGNAWNFGNNMVNNAYNAGQVVEGYQDRALEDAMSRHSYQYSEPMNRMQIAQNVAESLSPLGTDYGSYSGKSSGTTSGTNQQANPNYQSMGQAILGGAATGASMFSDRRLKTNVERIGTTPAGYPWYRFDYVWGEPGEGVMSDEVPPDWVRKHPSGYDMVDYGRVR